MKNRKLGPFDVGEIGLGCMNLSQAYGVPPSPEAGRRVLQKALDLGVTHFDCAALYGFGRNEELLGPILLPHRNRIPIVSKCGMRGENGKRVIDARPEKLAQDLTDSLRRLQTDVIDLYYLHRWDKKVPIEESIGAISRFVEQGKVRAVGLSEVSAETVLRAHAVHPIVAVQSEYSLWTRNAEIAIIDTCREIGAAFVAFSPLARGFLTSVELQPDTFTDKDFRRPMPRFQEPHYRRNCRLLAEFRALARDAACSPAQLALAWLLQQGPHVHVIPGTTSADHLEENVKAANVVIGNDIITRLDKLINQRTVSGPRYPSATQAEIDTEEF